MRFHIAPSQVPGRVPMYSSSWEKQGKRASLHLCLYDLGMTPHCWGLVVSCLLGWRSDVQGTACCSPTPLTFLSAPGGRREQKEFNRHNKEILPSFLWRKRADISSISMKPGCAVLTKQILDSFIKMFQFIILSLTLAAQILDMSLLQILKIQKLYLTFLCWTSTHNTWQLQVCWGPLQLVAHSPSKMKDGSTCCTTAALE